MNSVPLMLHIEAAINTNKKAVYPSQLDDVRMLHLSINASFALDTLYILQKRVVFESVS